MDAYAQIDHHPTISAEGKVPRVEVVKVSKRLATATLHCVDCFAVIDKADASTPETAEKVVRRRQVRRPIPRTHCPSCADHLGGLDHIPSYEAPAAFSAYAEARNEALLYEGIG